MEVDMIWEVLQPDMLKNKYTKDWMLFLSFIKQKDVTTRVCTTMYSVQHKSQNILWIWP